ncbi:GNAT family N-acetyltransferase [Cellulophaga baltica]|uniref:GNAT family N-acetyltransferase n=1 Tax=Cellulophaga TaxID=104264 RepID=UPI001C0718C2|nr:MULTISPECIES: GNAT family N-acetyltransferase [Cellulophaga]MBU2997406.1 GNAT family N-acetyltransferase [Cellulophaga baltica]MDO6768803.1 GNAT family N-acetyltransferase [Cellulophaga sp. 1_MG-2023]
MNEVILSKATKSDLLKVQDIARKCFKETFSSMNSEKNMKDYIEYSFSTKKIKKELSNPKSEFYLAKYKEEIIGYLKLNFEEAQTEIKDKNSVEIERIYVLSKFHGKKVGQLLYNKALAIAKHKMASYIWLGVWEENQRAIRFYQKNDFIVFDTHNFKLGDEVQTDFMMKLELNLIV